ncbi:hypothetical protein GCM10020369_56400 [Cryptosporangium minutisporangium]|uniref:Uncharacterized protein n=1 Tax=Cryptosporangium minutisporangium TaxID=113569 RepID=A0ABP6T654_9ACTN
MPGDRRPPRGGEQQVGRFPVRVDPERQAEDVRQRRGETGGPGQPDQRVVPARLVDPWHPDRLRQSVAPDDGGDHRAARMQGGRVAEPRHEPERGSQTGREDVGDGRGTIPCTGRPRSETGTNRGGEEPHTGRVPSRGTGSTCSPRVFFVARAEGVIRARTGHT